MPTHTVQYKEFGFRKAMEDGGDVVSSLCITYDNSVIHNSERDSMAIKIR